MKVTRRHDGIDLNLLAAMHALLEERSVTRAARRLGVTQPAVSRSLGRLRAWFGDPILVRAGGGMRPTARAEALAGPLRRALAELDAVVASEVRFDARTAPRRFVVSAVDYAHAVVLAPLAARLEEEAPAVSLVLRQASDRDERDLADGSLDLLVGPRQTSAAGVVWSSLYEEAYTCLVWRRHPRRRLSLPAFAALDHVLVAPWDRPGSVVDAALAERGLARRVAVQASTFLLVPHLLVGTRRVATVPSRLAAVLERSYPLRRIEAPIAVAGFTVCAAWHEVHRGDPGHRWLRERVAEIARRARA
jgi:DNA-binding transcriptional LysR family regulator